MPAPPPASLAIRPLTPARWADFETIFRARGCSIARMCWCMCYRRSGAHPAPPAGVSQAEANRRAFRSLVRRGVFTGVIAYRGRTPVGWLSFGPREDFARLERSPVMKPVDDRKVWSVICFVVPEEFRGQGVARALLQGAVAVARRKRVKLLEAYPVDKRGRASPESLWFGPKSMFDACGFEEVARRKPTRPVVRLQPV